MSTRKIKVVSTVGVSGVIETNVSTLGELKPLLRQREIDYGGMKMMVGETRNELNLDDAVLPEGDFKLYLMPSKTKSGNRQAIIELENCKEDLSKLYSKIGNTIATLRRAPSPTVKVDSDVEDLKRLAGSFEAYDAAADEENGSSSDWY